MASTSTQRPHARAKQNAHILVVEDETIIRFMISDNLRDAGYRVTEAATGDEAVIIINSGESVDLVLSDVRMPGSVDGLALLAYVTEKNPTLPVVLISGHLSHSFAVAQGATNFLAKPFRLGQALDIIEDELAKRRKRPAEQSRSLN